MDYPVDSIRFINGFSASKRNNFFCSLIDIDTFRIFQLYDIVVKKMSSQIYKVKKRHGNMDIQ